MNSRKNYAWPEGKKFAFSIFDDTDSASLANIGPVYRFLQDCGLRTTKSVWTLRNGGPGQGVGDTCENEAYRAFILDLQADGFEVGYHLATYRTSLREQSRTGLERFRQWFGSSPTAMTNHVGCREAIYWGSYRLTGWNRVLYNLATGFRKRAISFGHIEGDPHFWGDLCQSQITYVRNFVFLEANTLKACPFMPYFDPERPLVNAWFASSDGENAAVFNQCLSESAQDRLEAEGGACIMYTHFAKDFVHDGRLDPRFEELMRRLSRKEGWFVPVSTLLNFLRSYQGLQTVTPEQRTSLERHWLRQKLRRGTS